MVAFNPGRSQGVEVYRIWYVEINQTIIYRACCPWSLDDEDYICGDISRTENGKSARAVTHPRLCRSQLISESLNEPLVTNTSRNRGNPASDSCRYHHRLTVYSVIVFQ